MILQHTCLLVLDLLRLESLMSTHLLLLSQVMSKNSQENIPVSMYMLLLNTTNFWKMGMKTQFRQSIKLSTPTFPMRGGSYSRTPDHFDNLEQYT